MLQQWQAWKWQLWVVELFIFYSAIALGIPPAIGQSIATDGTLQPARVLTGPNYFIPQTDGLTVNNNLFHSFSRFNIGTGESAIFESATTIRNIFSRVTGGSPSSIDGLLATQNRDVNFFLMNPSGVIFGPNARLNIGSSTRGSFVVTTADALIFPGGQRFSARNPEDAAGLLKIVGDPSGFIAGQQAPGTIQNSGDLRVNPNQSLLFLGGDISLTGKGLSAPSGRIELGSVADGQVDFATTNNALSFVFRDDLPRMNVSLNGASLITSPLGSAAAGDVSIYAKDLTANNANLRAVAAVGSQNGGDVILDASDTVFLTKSSISTQALPLSLPPPLKIKIPSGDAGSVQIKANSSIEIVNQSNINTSSTDRNSGNIQIETMGSLRLADTVLTSQSDQGNAGNITLKAGDATSISKGSIDTATGSLSETTSGTSGNITIETGELTINKDTRMSTATTGAGQGGNITFTVTKGSFNVANSEIRTRTNNRGNAGNIDINAADSVNVSGTLSNVSVGGLYTRTEGDGRAGNITITSNSVRVSDNAVFDAQTTTTGTGGTIEVTAQTLDVNSGGQLRTITSGSGRAGDVITNLEDRITLSGNNTKISASTSGNGDAGNLSLNTQDLSISDGAQISAATSSQGAGGIITVTANSLTLTSGGQLITTASDAGKAGDITANVRDRIALSGNGTKISASTSGSGKAGNLTLNTANITISDGAQISAETSGEGKGGSISVTARSFEANTGGQLRTTTWGSGNAGNITTTIEDKITLAGIGTGLLANTTPESSGNGGNIIIDPQTVVIRDGARVTVDSQGRGQGGNIQIQAENLTLDNRGQISAETASSQGGNITLQVGNLLLMRRGSQISTTAGKAQARGDGGNIQINALFVAAIPNENSDITANAFTGRGGRVDITTRGIFGIVPNVRLTPLSDITASSQFGISGVITINTPDIDPSRGLVQLPGTPVDPSNQIRQTCRPAAAQQASSFVVTGRGGLPISPERTIQQTPLIGWVTVDDGKRGQEVSGNSGESEKNQNRSAEYSNQSPNAKIQNSPIIEAQGWIKDAQGNVWLVSDAPVTSVRADRTTEPVCR